MTKTERNVVAVAMVLSFLWAGGLVTAYLLQTPPAVSLSDYEPNAVPNNPTIKAGGGPTKVAEAAVVPGVLNASTDDRRKRLVTYWQTQSNRYGEPQPSQARLTDQAGVIQPATADAAAKLVTLHLKDVTPRVALAALGKQAGVRFLVAPAEMLTQIKYPPISLDADQQPLVEVIARLCGQTGLMAASPQNAASMISNSAERLPTPTPDRPIAWLQSRPPGEGPGPRVTVGPFQFEMRQIERSASLDPDADPIAPAICTLAISTEPGVVIVAQQQNVVATEAADDLGHSLLRADGGGGGEAVRKPRNLGELLRRRGRSLDNDNPWQSPQSELTLQLICPADAGRTIKSLKASARFLLRTKAETLDIGTIEKVVIKDIAGLRISLGPIQADGDQQITYPIRIDRGKMDDATWQRLRPHLNQLPSTLLDAEGRMWPGSFYSGYSSGEDYVALRPTWMRQPRNTDGTITPRTPTKFYITVPTEVKEITVPFEFTDLPLP